MKKVKAMTPPEKKDDPAIPNVLNLTENRNEPTEQTTRMKNHIQVNRLQYSMAPSGKMPPETRSAKRIHKGFRPGRSESPNSIANKAQSISYYGENRLICLD